MEKLWTTSEVARFLGITEADVEQLVQQGKLTGYKLGGQFLRFRPDQVEALKGTMRFRPTTATSASLDRHPQLNQFRDFLYFYDFYIVSAILLTVVVLYLVAAG